jgi:phosphomannomutase / phosphoglucomutase
MPKITPSIFRAADIRGLVNEAELNPTTVELLGLGYGTFLAHHGIDSVIVGYDGRESSPDFRQAMAAGLRATGCDVIDIGMVVTPMVYWSQYYLRSRGAVVITGSHNPPEWNGFKMARGYSYTIVGEEVQQIRQIIENAAFVHGHGNYVKMDISDAYLNDLTARVNITRPFKIVVDAGNGIAGKYMPELYRRAGCEVVELFCDLDSTFPNHFPDPTIVESRKAISEEICRTGADLGLSFDGDGDRLGVNDEHGETIWSDLLLALWSRDILSRNPGGRIVFDVKCSQALIDEIQVSGGVPVMCRTGHPFVKAKAKEVNAVLAGEVSGHIFFVERFYGVDDAGYAGLRLLEYLCRSEVPLSHAIASLPQYESTPEGRVGCPDNSKYSIAADIAKQFLAEGYEVSELDGARVKFSDGWGAVRASSNLPMLTLRFEGRTKEALNRISWEFQKKLDSYPEVARDWENITRPD